MIGKTTGESSQNKRIKKDNKCDEFERIKGKSEEYSNEFITIRS